MRFNDLLLILRGATSGEQILKSAATASGAITLPAGTTDFSGSGPGLVQQASAGAAFTVAATSPSLTVGSPGAVSGGTLTGDLVAQRVIVNANAATAPAPYGVGNIQVVGADVAVPSIEASAFGGASPANGTIGRFISRRANGTGAAATAVLSGNAIGAFNVIGYGATGYSAPRGTIQYNATENWDDTHQGAALNVFATPTGGTATATVATFQTGVQVGAPTGGDKGAGTLNATGVYAGGVLLTSDARLKRDIEPLPDGCLELVGAIEPKRFKFIEPVRQPSPDEDSAPTPAGPEGWFNRTRWGFLAQDVAPKLPDAVESDAEGNQYLSPSDLTACLWRGVQELTARVTALEAALDARSGTPG